MVFAPRVIKGNKPFPPLCYAHGVLTATETLPLDYSPAGFIVYMVLMTSEGLWLQAVRAEDEPQTRRMGWVSLGHTTRACSCLFCNLVCISPSANQVNWAQPTPKHSVFSPQKVLELLQEPAEKQAFGDCIWALAKHSFQEKPGDLRVQLSASSERKA